MAKLNIVILFGGKSGEHEVSITSALSVYNALDKEKYHITLVGIDKEGRWLLPEQTKILAQSSNPRLIKLNEAKKTIGLLPFPSEKNLIAADQSSTPLDLSVSKPDVVIPILHGTFGEDGTVQGLLELAGLPYVGSGVLGSAVCMDKELSKRVLRDSGIPVVPFFVIRAQEFAKKTEQFLDRAEKEFGYPYFVKPANTGSSVGVHKIKNKSEAIDKIKDSLLYDTKVLVEKAIDAREIECAVLGDEEAKASVLGEIIPRHEFYSYEAKYIDENGADLRVPASDISKEIEGKIRTLAVKAFLALECHGMARVDFFIDKRDGNIYLNELNTIPGFTKISMYPKMWEASGLAYPKLLDELIRLALKRHDLRSKLKTDYEPKS
ncbi:MAG: D-alanine--D-alanine ligase family protein [Bacteriovoracia bacterium]